MKKTITRAWGQTPAIAGILSVVAILCSLTAHSQEVSYSAEQFTEPMASELLYIQQQWAIVNYQTDESEQEDAFEDLLMRIDQLARLYPNTSEPKVWQGIIRSTYAGFIGGLSALSYVKDARDYLLSAKKLDDTTLGGSVYTSLGTLYAKVPGWPIAFGDDDKARKLLSKAVEINPSGLDPNYFYADFLYEEGEYKKALSYLNLALLAPKRENRSLADSQRMEEVKRLMKKVKAEI